MVTVFGNEVVAKVDGIVRFACSPICRRLLEGDAPVDESYPGCKFRMTSNIDGITTPCNVRLTGGRPQRWGGELWIRCEVEWVKDGEPSEFSRGFYRV